jgi:hypothetical protein
MWLGACVSIASLSWIVTLVAMVAIEPEASLLITAGLGISVTVSMSTVAAWIRHDLSASAAKQQAQLQLVNAGQYTLAMAELRNLRRLIEQTAGHATAERQAISAKLTVLEQKVSGTYWHGVADTVEQMTGTDDNVFQLARGRAKVPHDT